MARRNVIIESFARYTKKEVKATQKAIDSCAYYENEIIIFLSKKKALCVNASIVFSVEELYDIVMEAYIGGDYSL